MKKILFIAIVIICQSCLKEVKIHPFEDQAFGCQSFTVYKLASNQKATIAVIADRNSLELDSTWKLFKLNSNDLKVIYTSHSKDSERLYCNDVANNKEATEWETTSGSVDIRIKSDSIHQNPLGSYYYEVDLFAKNLTFRNGRKKIYLDSISFLNVSVGELPG